MKKKARLFLWMHYMVLAICALFYIVLLQAPTLFLAGVTGGLVVYAACYGFIYIGWRRLVTSVLLTIYFSLFAYMLYALWYILQKMT